MEQAGAQAYSFVREPRPRKYWLYAVCGSLVVHAALAALFAYADENVAPPRGRVQVLCAKGRRCPMEESYARRRNLDDLPLPPAGLIQARVIPRLGLAEQNPKALPELQKYEQPEYVEDGINIANDIDKPYRFDRRAFEKKQAQLDRDQRKKRRSLADLLDSPDDGDPRRRARHLSRIIGDPDGATWGTGTEAAEGDAYLAEIQIEIYKNFQIPSHLSDDAVGKLRMVAIISKMSAGGEILEYRIQYPSANKDYDLAAEAALKRFKPSEGGTYRLPAAKPEMLQRINTYGLNVDFDGRLFRR